MTRRGGWLHHRIARAFLLGLPLLPLPSAALVRIGLLELDTAYGVHVVGSLAYVGTASGLSIVDVADGAHPSLVGQLDLPATVRDVAVAGGRAYLATVGAGLRVVDVADPSAPAELGSFDPGVALFSLEVAGALAYATDGNGSLRILDVSNPSAPAEVGSFASPGFASGVALAGPIAFLADGDSGLRVLDVSDPAAPVERAAADGFHAFGVQLAGSRAYVTSGGGGRILDVSDPAAPAVLCELPGGIALDVEEPHAFFTLGDGGLRAIDLGACGEEAGLGQITTGSVQAVDVVGRTAYLAHERGLELVDLSHLEAPRVASRGGSSRDFPTGVAAEGGLVWFTSARTGLSILDPADPSQPRVIGSIPLPGAIDVAVSAGLAALLTPTDLRGVAVADPSAPETLDPVTRFFGVDVELRGSLAFVVGGQPPSPFFPPEPGFFAVYDLSDAASPVRVGELELPSRPVDLDVAGSLAFVADGPRGLRVIDVSNPASPVERAVLGLPDEALAVSVADGVALVAAGAAGLRSIDVRDPAAPFEIASLDVGHGRDVERSGDLAWVSGQLGGFFPRGFVRAVDVSDPSAPRVLGGVTTLASAFDVERGAGLSFSVDERSLAIADFGPEYPDLRVRAALERIGRGAGAPLRAALYGSEAVDAAQIDPDTLGLGPAGAAPLGRVSLADLDGDGHRDLTARFQLRAAGLAPSDTAACLRARLFSGERLDGCAPLPPR